MKENSAHGFTEGSEVPKEQDAAHSFEKTHPDFPEWIETEAGKGCLQWPISEVKYLRNRLFWAFDAGRNCVWDQYTEQKKKLTRLRTELQQKDEEINLREAQQDVMAADAVKLLDQIEYQNKSAKEDHDMIKKLEFQISNCDSEFNLPSAAVFNLQQIALADDDMVKVPGAAEQYRFIARHILELFQKSKAK